MNPATIAYNISLSPWSFETPTQTIWWSFCPRSNCTKQTIERCFGKKTTLSTNSSENLFSLRLPEGQHHPVPLRFTHRSPRNLCSFVSAERNITETTFFVCLLSQKQDMRNVCLTFSEAEIYRRLLSVQHVPCEILDLRGASTTMPNDLIAI